MHSKTRSPSSRLKDCDCNVGSFFFWWFASVFTIGIVLGFVKAHLKNKVNNKCSSKVNSKGISKVKASPKHKCMPPASLFVSQVIVPQLSVLPDASPLDSVPQVSSSLDSVPLDTVLSAPSVSGLSVPTVDATSSVRDASPLDSVPLVMPAVSAPVVAKVSNKDVGCLAEMDVHNDAPASPIRCLPSSPNKVARCLPANPARFLPPSPSKLAASYLPDTHPIDAHSLHDTGLHASPAVAPLVPASSQPHASVATVPAPSAFTHSVNVVLQSSSPVSSPVVEFEAFPPHTPHDSLEDSNDTGGGGYLRSLEGRLALAMSMLEEVVGREEERLLEARRQTAMIGELTQLVNLLLDSREEERLLEPCTQMSAHQQPQQDTWKPAKVTTLLDYQPGQHLILPPFLPLLTPPMEDELFCGGADRGRGSDAGQVDLGGESPGQPLLRLPLL